MTSATVAGEELVLEPDQVRQIAADLDPEPLRVLYVVIDGRRYPPKQVLAAVSGLDRADFTSHQARSVLRRLGFGVHRLSTNEGRPVGADTPAAGPHGGAEARMLEQFVGRWVAQDGMRILFDADSPEEVVAWLRRHGQTGRVWRIPSSPLEAGSTWSTP